VLYRVKLSSEDRRAVWNKTVLKGNKESFGGRRPVVVVGIAA
jgi:hypothetical protein